MLRATVSILGALAQRRASEEPDLDYQDRYRFLVWPWHLDLNGHVNNATYFTWANQARLVFLSRSGILQRLIRDRSRPVLRENRARYFRSLKAFEKFEVHTRISNSATGEYLITHEFFRGAKQVAIIESSAIILGKGGKR